MGDVLICIFCKKSSGKIVIFSEETLKKCQTLEIKKKKNIILSIKILFYQLNKQKVVITENVINYLQDL